MIKVEACSHLEFHAWYHNDGVLAGPISEVHRALILIKDRSGLSLFPSDMKQSHNPNIEILGIHIGDKDFCSAFIARSGLRPGTYLKDLKKLVQHHCKCWLP